MKTHGQSQAAGVEALAILRKYPALRGQALEVAPAPRGFSGAEVLKVQAGGRAYALRAWPPEQSAAGLALVHAAQQELTTAGFLLTPKLEHAAGGATWVEANGRLWELATWRPGEAGGAAGLPHRRLRQASRALSQIHACWASGQPPRLAECAAVRQRLERLDAWTPPQRQAAQVALRAVADAELRELMARALTRLAREGLAAAALLRPWVQRRVPSQRVLTDLWREHMLFVGEDLTGIVDLEGVRTETPAAALARLLSSCTDGSPSAWSEGVAAFREAQPFSAAEEELLNVLRLTATVGGLETWLRWLLRERQALAADPRAKTRLRELLAAAC